MGPIPLRIVIPHRPVYKPGSGPAMAPVTLHPDNSDTGWMIADAVDFQGVTQYVVTPLNNPAHRRPVKKQHILDWVSPKAHEDFEYAQYMIRREEALERDNQRAAKLAAIKERRHETGLVKERKKARRPFARYMQLEQIEESDRGNTSGRLSSPEQSPDELMSEAPLQLKKSRKRKHSASLSQPAGPPTKLQDFPSSSKASLAWKIGKPPLSSPRLQSQAGISEDETDVEEGMATIPTADGADSTHMDILKRPILPPERRPRTPRTVLTPQKSSISPHAAPSLFIPATVSPSRIPQKLHENKSHHLLQTSSKTASPAPLRTQPDTTIVQDVPLFTPSSHGYVHKSVLFPTMFSWPAASTNSAHNGVSEPSEGGLLKRKRNSFSSIDESNTMNSQSKVNTKGIPSNPKPSRDKETMGSSQFLGSDHQTSFKQERGKRSRSNSSSSSNVLRWPKGPKSPKVFSKQSDHSTTMKTDQNGKGKEVGEDSEDAEDREDDNEETWEIHGILDDEIRDVNGLKVRYYLCEWVGDYDPTWEPKENFSTDAIKKYEKKKRREGFGFDGAADEDTIWGNQQDLGSRTVQRPNDFLRSQNGTSNSEASTRAPPPMFLAPNGNPLSSSRTSSANSEAAVDADIMRR